MPTEKSILFSGEMPRAIIEGRKNKTRRCVNMACIDFRGAGGTTGTDWNDPSCWGFEDEHGQQWALAAGDGIYRVIPSPYGPVGTRLWVREACWIWGQWHRDCKTPTGRDKWRFKPIGQQVRFDKPERTAKRGGAAGWVYRHARFMPRWACRTVLEKTGERVERLWNITEEDAVAEGFTPGVCVDVFRRSPGWQEAEEAYYAEDAKGEEYDGWYCYEHSAKLAGKRGNILAGCTPETDGPAYCDKCGTPLALSLSEYGIERELRLEDDPEGKEPELFPAFSLDASIAYIIADGIGDLQEKHHGRMAQIGFATYWEQLNGDRPGCSWADNPWVRVISFKRVA
ncbi:MAG: hypothetical protein WCX88_03280 [Patescibacteria group bacterium]